MSDKYNKMKDFLADLEADVDKFYNKGQSAAGTRIRKAMSEIKNMAQDIRVEVQDIKNEKKNG